MPLAPTEVLLETSAANLAGHDDRLPRATARSLRPRWPPKNSGEDVVVHDCGADQRLVDPADGEGFYGTPHAGSWHYGLPELAGQRRVLAGATRIAVPGCFPTAATLALAPAVTQGLVATDDVVVVAATGTSGAGKGAKTNLLGSEVMGSATAYGVGGTHRHTPEIEQSLRLAGAETVVVSFTPVLVPMSRGILATCTATAVADVDIDDLRAAYEKATADEPFWHLLPVGQWPQSQAVLGSNTAHLQVALDVHAGRVVAVCAIDNLTKGTAGGAIQSMNIALGLPETTGLSAIGVTP